MAAKWIEALTGSLEQKKQYKQAKARIDALPSPYREVARRMRFGESEGRRTASAAQEAGPSRIPRWPDRPVWQAAEK